MIACFAKTTTCLLALFVVVTGPGARPAHADGKGGTEEPLAAVQVGTAAGLRAALLYDGLWAPAPSVRLSEGGTRNVPLAFGMSAVVPGLGQAYNRQWLKAAVAVVAEVALIAGYATWQSRGVDGRDAYQDYAHAYWSPARYASWINDYAASIGVAARVQSIPQDVDYTHPENWTSSQIQAVRRMINEIRAVESVATHPNGASFSHKLPYFGEQQYYELVGKYNQFAPGWDDYGYWVTGEDGEAVYLHPDTEDLSSRFLDYAHDHGRANDYLRRASRMSIFFIVNHLVAAVDAAVSARLHNNRLQARIEMSVDASGEPQPVASLRLTL